MGKVSRDTKWKAKAQATVQRYVWGRDLNLGMVGFWVTVDSLTDHKLSPVGGQSRKWRRWAQGQTVRQWFSDLGCQ